MDKWTRYLLYLRDWTYIHMNREYEGMSPVCYQEWLDNEYIEEEEYYA